ncbi:MAG: transglycosylase domain-containing protein [Actinomycetota bacterium]|nr:transglycosylase domain-containing protein [Acidimicrobiia bacterium]MDQ3293911.1 transglycosylase domain-containing protein [Actinomycetota bacterium]
MRGFLKNVLAMGIVALATPLAAAGVLLGTLVYLPLPATLPQPTPGLERLITHVVDREGNEFAVFKEFETQISVLPTDIPQVLKDAVIAAEDRSFYQHGGFDLRGTVRALWTDVRTGESAQGGSTITQQYVRQAFAEVGTERTVARKIREAILASQLDRQIDKEEILFRYLSTIYFGEGAYGIGAAAQTYFRKSPRDLTLSEAALLVGTIPAPTLYSPRDHPDSAETKRKIVLDSMLEVGFITPQQHAAATAEVLWLAVNGPPPGPATIVQPPENQQTSQPWFTDYVRQWLVSSGLLPDCTPEACPILYRGGLRIETTLDLRAQLLAQNEVNQVLAGSPENLEASIVAVEPPTGFVRAIVGGRDFALSQVNTGLRERQPGSTFKVFVLAAAFEQGIQPTTVYSGAPHTIGEQTFQNYGGAQYGSLPLRAATTNSVNTVFTRLLEDVTVTSTFDLAARLGVAMPATDPTRSTPNFLVDAADPNRGYGLSVALGAVETTPLEMASAYGVFANHGRRAPPTPVLRVIDAAGNVLIDNAGAEAAAAQVIAPEVADNVTDVLRGVLTDGTAEGRALAGGRPAAGKTGTAQENANAWFIGYTPTLSTAVWIGYRDCGAGPQCALVNVAGHRGRMTGGSVPARIWQRFMNLALEDVEVTEFTEPAPIPDVRDEVLREQRRGFAPGRRRSPSGAPASGGFVEDEGQVFVDAPLTTTSTTEAPTTTTPTTVFVPPTTTPFTLLPP